MSCSIEWCAGKCLAARNAKFYLLQSTMSVNLLCGNGEREWRRGGDEAGVVVGLAGCGCWVALWILRLTVRRSIQPCYALYNTR